MNLVWKAVDRYRRVGLVQATRNAFRGLIQHHGTPAIKRAMWNKEFARGHWDRLDETPGDCIYPFLEKYAIGRSILDLGCGAGNTANELRFDAYRHYTGIDISDVAVEKAAKRSAGNGRSAKNRFSQGELRSYVPTGRYQVILFRESMQYITPPKIKGMLDRYAHFLEEDGVFLVREMNLDVEPIIEVIENNYEIIEKYLSEQPKAVVLVFRTRN